MVFIFRVLSRHFGFAGDWEKIGARMSVGVGGGFGGFHLSSVKPPFWICWRLGEDWGENVGGGGGRFWWFSSFEC